MKKFFILSCLLAACVFFTGCYGLVVAHPRQKISEQFCLGSRGVVFNGVSDVLVTETNLLMRWGPPDAQRFTTNDMIVWQYRGQMGWLVAMPGYMLMIPIPFPTGYDQVEIYFQDGIARQASRQVMVYTGVMLGVINVLAWEKEGDFAEDTFRIGYGFIEEAEEKLASSSQSQPAHPP